MVFADTEEIDAYLICQHALFDNVADDLGIGERLSVGAVGDVTKRIQPKFKRVCHSFPFRGTAPKTG
jgi:hypothetical protein